MHRLRPAIVAIVSFGVLAAGCGDDSVETTEDPGGSTTTSSTTSSTTTAPEPSGGPAASDLAALEPGSACGDAVWHFATPDDDVLLRINIPGLLASIADEGVVDRSYDIADTDSGATATLETGTSLGATACNDVPSRDYEVTDTRSATKGNVRLEIPEVPAGPLEVCATSVETTLSVDSISFEVDGEILTTGLLSLTSPIGWCPG